jgi:hypothetical protein
MTMKIIKIWNDDYYEQSRRFGKCKAFMIGCIYLAISIYIYIDRWIHIVYGLHLILVDNIPKLQQMNIPGSKNPNL